MNTLPALLSKLQTKGVTREMQFLCAIIDAQVASHHDRLLKLEGKSADGVTLESDGTSMFDGE